eukprot:1155125-Pelagomonas_calceolata.AAC.10
MAWVLVWALLSISTSLWASAQQQQQQQQQAPGSIAQHDGEQRPSITPVHVVFLVSTSFAHTSRFPQLHMLLAP